MCSDSDVYGRNQSLFHINTGDWGVPLEAFLLFCPRLVQAVSQAVQKQTVLTEGKHQVICNVTCDLWHSFKLEGWWQGCKKLPLKGNGELAFCVWVLQLFLRPHFSVLYSIWKENTLKLIEVLPFTSVGPRLHKCVCFFCWLNCYYCFQHVILRLMPAPHKMKLAL